MNKKAGNVPVKLVCPPGAVLCHSFNFRCLVYLLALLAGVLLFEIIIALSMALPGNIAGFITRAGKVYFGGPLLPIAALIIQLAKDHGKKVTRVYFVPYGLQNAFFTIIPLPGIDV